MSRDLEVLSPCSRFAGRGRRHTINMGTNAEAEAEADMGLESRRGLEGMEIAV